MNNQLIRGNLFLFSKPEPESKQFEKGERFFLNQAGTTESLFIVLRVTKENQLILARAFPTQQKNTCKVIIGRKEYWVRFSNLLFAERKWLSDITIYQGRCSYGNISKIYSCYNNWKEQIKKQAREKAIRKIKHCTTCLYSSSSRYIWNLSFFIGLPPLFLLCLSPFKKPLPDKCYIFIFIRGYENMYAAKRFFDFLGEVGFAASYCIRNFYEFDFPLST